MFRQQGQRIPQRFRLAAPAHNQGVLVRILSKPGYLAPVQPAGFRITQLSFDDFTKGRQIRGDQRGIEVQSGLYRVLKSGTFPGRCPRVQVKGFFNNSARRHLQPRIRVFHKSGLYRLDNAMPPVRSTRPRQQRQFRAAAVCAQTKRPPLVASVGERRRAGKCMEGGAIDPAFHHPLETGKGHGKPVFLEKSLVSRFTDVHRCASAFCPRWISMIQDAR